MLTNKKALFIGFGPVGRASVRLFNPDRFWVYDPRKLTDLPACATQIRKDLFDETVQRVQVVVISIPTPFKPQVNTLDTQAIHNYVRRIARANPLAWVVIRSTLPLGSFTRFTTVHNRVVYMPEFLTETALGYKANIERVIVGHDLDEFGLGSFKRLLVSSVPVQYEPVGEVIATKLYANTYLAMRVAFFNELDTELRSRDIDPFKVIELMGQDKRIGDYYNNPSFGFGGKCLPKDVDEVEASLQHLSPVLRSIRLSNEARLAYLVEQIRARNPMFIGFYRLGMKEESTTLTASPSIELIQILMEYGYVIRVYDDLLENEPLEDVDWLTYPSDLNECDLVIANRYHPDLALLDIEVLCFDRTQRALTPIEKRNDYGNS